MKVGLLGAIAALLVVAPVSEAAAKSVRIDAVGTVAFGTDEAGLFGGGSLAGAAFSFTGTLNLTNAYYSNIGFRTDILGGEAYDYLPGPTPPSLGNAIMTINGIETTIIANWNTTLTASYWGEDIQAFQQYGLASAPGVQKSVTLVEQPGAGLFDLANYQAPTGNRCPTVQSCNTGNFSANVLGVSTFAQLNATSITFTMVPDAPEPAAVPEPSAWALMICGFGLAGGALRRRRAESATA